MQERRKFERVSLPQSAKLSVESISGEKMGLLRMLGRGGFQLETKDKYAVGDRKRFVIRESDEGIRREVEAVARNMAPGNLVGFEFHNLDADAAVEIGVIIGKYYSAAYSRSGEG